MEQVRHTQESSTEAAGFDINDLQLAVENNDEVIDGGVLDVAVVTDTQPKGCFNGSFIKMLMTVTHVTSHEYLFLPR